MLEHCKEAFPHDRGTSEISSTSVDEHYFGMHCTHSVESRAVFPKCRRRHREVAFSCEGWGGIPLQRGTLVNPSDFAGAHFFLRIHEIVFQLLVSALMERPLDSVSIHDLGKSPLVLHLRTRTGRNLFTAR